MTGKKLVFKISPPVASLSDYVESIWMIANNAGEPHEIVVLPDGRFDILFSYSASEPYHVTLRGLDTQPSENSVLPYCVLFGISFKLPAIEYLLRIRVNSILNEGRLLPDDFWGISKDNLQNFDEFCTIVMAKMISLVKQKIDARKQQLFRLIYSSNGTMPISELSKKVYWSKRQMNRYFNLRFGLSVKAYCKIVRFRESLYSIREGNLYPALDFTDQNHFIKEVKKFAGVVPKELFKNKNDRFILLSAMPGK